VGGRSWQVRAFEVADFQPVSVSLNKRISIGRFRSLSVSAVSVEDHGDVFSMLLCVQDTEDGAFPTDNQVRDEMLTLFLMAPDTCRWRRLRSPGACGWHPSTKSSFGR
jgi:hypothetical protein